MNTQKYALLAAAKVLKQAPELASAQLSVDGRAIDQQAAALAFERASALGSSKPHPRLERALDHLTLKAKDFEDKLQTSRAGRAANKVMQAKPEWVNTRVVVNVKTADGRSIDISVRVTDRRRTALLQKLSLAAYGLDLSLPVIGFLVPLAGASAAVFTSFIARAGGDKPLADALRKVAAKHAILGTLTAPPFFGEAVATLAVVNDAMHVTKSARAVTVAELEKLGG